MQHSPYDEESFIRAKTVSSADTRDAFVKKITLNEILGHSASSDVEPVRTSYAKRGIHSDYHEDLEIVKGHKVCREQLSMRLLLKKFCWIAIGSAPSSKFDSPSISAMRTNFLWRDFISTNRRAAA